MKTTPILSSIIATDYVAEFVTETYDFSTEVTCEILRIGINHSYLITTSTEKYVFRVYFYKWRTELEIKEELRFLNLLKAEGLLVSTPLNDTNQNYLQTLNAPEGNRFGVLFTYAEGENFRNPTEDLSFKLGENMAKFHKISINKNLKRINYTSETLNNWAFTKVKIFFEPSKRLDYFSRSNTIITKEFASADTSKLRTGVVHSDLWHDNLKVKNNTEITYFDFDNCGNGWLFLDLAYSLMLLFRNEPDKSLFDKKRDAFYKGYESIMSISSEEKRLIPFGGLAIWLYYTGIHVQRFNDFSNQFLSEDFLTYWLNTVDSWMKHNSVDI